MHVPILFRWSLRMSFGFRVAGLYRLKNCNGWWAFRFFREHEEVIGLHLESPDVRMPPLGNQ